MSKKIIIFITVLFIASSSWLFYVNHNEINPDTHKNWWALSFQDPRSNNFGFIIENHSQEINFHWQLLKNEHILTQGDLKIVKGSSQKIPLILSNFYHLPLKGKFILRVKTKDNQKEIYKNL